MKQVSLLKASFIPLVFSLIHFGTILYFLHRCFNFGPENYCNVYGFFGFFFALGAPAAILLTTYSLGRLVGRKFDINITTPTVAVITLFSILVFLMPYYVFISSGAVPSFDEYLLEKEIQTKERLIQQKIECKEFEEKLKTFLEENSDSIPPNPPIYCQNGDIKAQ